VAENPWETPYFDKLYSIRVLTRRSEAINLVVSSQNITNREIKKKVIYLKKNTKNLMKNRENLSRIFTCPFLSGAATKMHWFVPQKEDIWFVS
jgi:hypothetical protein